MVGGQKKRRWRRLQSELRVRLTVVDAARGGRSISAIGTHLNPEGIFIQLADPPAPGTRVKVTLESSGSQVGPSAEGEVVTQLRLDQTRKTPPGCGVHLQTKGPGWDKIYMLLADSGLDMVL